MSRKDDFNLPSDRKGGGGRKFEQKTIKYEGELKWMDQCLLEHGGHWCHRCWQLCWH